MRSRPFLLALSPLLLLACVSDLPALSDKDASAPPGPEVDAAFADAPHSLSEDGGHSPADAALDAVDATQLEIDSGSGDAAMPPFDGGTCYPKPPGIISFYTGDGETADRGPAGNDLTWSGSGAPAYAPAKVGKGFSLNNELLSALAPKGLDGLSAFSIEAWIQPATADGGAAPIDGNFINRSSGTNGWAVWLKGWQLRFDLVPGGLSYGQVNTIALGALTHIAVTFDGKIVNFYTNGNLDAQHAVTDGGVIPLPDQGGDLRIGAQQGTRATFFGLVDELTLYDRALAKSEIQGIVKADSFGKCRP